jgi:S-DNA-T family DNA segregation ATPase FtsK/SpoIIIE
LSITDTFCAYERPEVLFLGKDGDVRLPDTGLIIEIRSGTLTITGDIEEEKVYLNRRRLLKNSARILKGDCLFLAGVKFVYYPDHIRIYGEKERYQTSLPPVEKEELPYKGFPDYKRSPRIIKRVPTDPVEIKAPPEQIAPKKGGFL